MTCLQQGLTPVSRHIRLTSAPHELSVVTGYFPVVVALAFPEDDEAFALRVAFGEVHDSVVLMVVNTVVEVVESVESELIWALTAAAKRASSGNWTQGNNMMILCSQVFQVVKKKKVLGSQRGGFCQNLRTLDQV